MTETLSAKDGANAAGPASDRDHMRDHQRGGIADLRRTGINPDFWYPVAVSGSVRRNKTFAATFAGERIALYRGQSGTVYALEDRCAHRQVPLSMGVVEGADPGDSARWLSVGLWIARAAGGTGRTMWRLGTA